MKEVKNFIMTELTEISAYTEVEQQKFEWSGLGGGGGGGGMKICTVALAKMNIREKKSIKLKI